MTRGRKIPKLKSDDEIAAFWDSHDFTGYIGDTEVADDVVFERPRRESIGIRLEKEKIKELKQIAQRVGLNYTSLVRSWIIERLAKIHARKHHRVK